MDLGISARVKPILATVQEFIAERVDPVEQEYFEEVNNGDRWLLNERQTEIIESLKTEAQKQGLWNFFLTHSERGHGISTVE